MNEPSFVDECWEVYSAQSRGGYARVRVRGRPQLAHRFIYGWIHGEVPRGMEVMHKCDNPTCCNPAHLRWGTHEENTADMFARGRARGQFKPKHAR